YRTAEGRKKRRHAEQCLRGLSGRRGFRLGEFRPTAADHSALPELDIFHCGLCDDHSRGLHQLSQRARCQVHVQRQRQRLQLRCGDRSPCLPGLRCLVVLDAYFPQISNAKERKYIVIGDLVFSVAWTLLWFICFCVLANQWSHTTDKSALPGDAAQAVVAFSFFSVISWALLSYFAYARYRQGVNDFDQDYRDPASDHTTPYPPAPYASGPTGYQQSPFAQNQEQPGDYQPPAY
uniref:MARVEL domain-containing protein n=1 Tax=Scophthalmus maximus TaxID=52904 RepID=A0A8D3DLK3_SCOMX